MSTAISQTKYDAFKSLLNEQTTRAQLQKSLGENAGAFLSSMLDLYSGEPQLQKYDPVAVKNECLKAASLKLPIVKALGFAYVVPFKDVPTFVIGYKGLIQLAQRSGQYKYINADVVYEGEEVRVNRLTGAIDFSGEKKSDKVVGYFAYIQTMSGFEKALYMTTEQMRDWGSKYSPSYNTPKGTWKTNFDSMALKTVLKRLISKYGPMSTEMAQALEIEDTGKTPTQERQQYANTGETINVDAVVIDPDDTNNSNEGENINSTQPAQTIESAAGF